MLGEFDEHRYSPQAAIYKARDLMSDDSLIPKSVVTLYQWINDGVFRTSNLDLLRKLNVNTINLIHKPKSA